VPRPLQSRQESHQGVREWRVLLPQDCSICQRQDNDRASVRQRALQAGLRGLLQDGGQGPADRVHVPRQGRLIGPMQQRRAAPHALRARPIHDFLILSA